MHPNPARKITTACFSATQKTSVKLKTVKYTRRLNHDWKFFFVKNKSGPSYVWSQEKGSSAGIYDLWLTGFPLQNLTTYRTYSRFPPLPTACFTSLALSSSSRRQPAAVLTQHPQPRPAIFKNPHRDNRHSDLTYKRLMESLCSLPPRYSQESCWCGRINKPAEAEMLTEVRENLVHFKAFDASRASHRRLCSSIFQKTWMTRPHWAKALNLTFKRTAGNFSTEWQNWNVILNKMPITGWHNFTLKKTEQDAFLKKAFLKESGLAVW